MRMTIRTVDTMALSRNQAVGRAGRRRLMPEKHIPRRKSYDDRVKNVRSANIVCAGEASGKKWPPSIACPRTSWPH